MTVVRFEYFDPLSPPYMNEVVEVNTETGLEITKWEFRDHLAGSGFGSIATFTDMPLVWLQLELQDD